MLILLVIALAVAGVLAAFALAYRIATVESGR